MINSLDMSHLQYPAVLLSTVDNNLIITFKQLSWAVEACYHRSKFKSSTDIKLQQTILPVHLLLDYRITCYIFLLVTNRKPAFISPNDSRHLLLTTRNIKELESFFIEQLVGSNTTIKA